MPDADMKAEVRRLRRENARLYRMAVAYRALISKAEHLGYCRGTNPEDAFERSIRNALWKQVEAIDAEADALRKDPASGVLLNRAEYEKLTGRIAELNVQELYALMERAQTEETNG